ncbi:hypothetical protein ACOSP7_029238 [Xanthoceras sorbifolium]
MVLEKFFTTPLAYLIVTKSLHAFGLSLAISTSDEVALEAALEATAEILNNAVKPVMVAGPKLFVSKAYDISSLGNSLLFKKDKAIIIEP